MSVFRQRLVHRDPSCIVTLMERTPLPAPVRVDGRVVLEPAAPAVWFTFPGAWHDIGRFHTANGVFTGCYANVLTPVRFRTPLEWETTDLFVDVWQDADGSACMLDEDELDDAVTREWVAADLADSARAEAHRLLTSADSGAWPPPIVRAWPLDRALSAVGGTRAGDTV